MVELKEDIIEITIFVLAVFNLIETRRNVTQIIEVLWSDLTDMQVNQIAVVSIDFKQLVFSQILCFQPVLDMDMFMRKHDRRMSVFIARCLCIVYFDVLIFFVFINGKVEIGFSLHLLVCFC